MPTCILRLIITATSRKSTLTSDLFMICLVHDHARNIERNSVKIERGEWKAFNDDLKCAHARFQYIELKILIHKNQK